MIVMLFASSQFIFLFSLAINSHFLILIFCKVLSEKNENYEKSENYENSFKLPV